MISWTGTLACEISESNDMSLVACMVIPELIPVWRRSAGSSAGRI